MEIYISNDNLNKQERTHITKHMCSLCCSHTETRCDEVKHAERGFCISEFTNFTSESISFKLDDSIKEYLNKQAIIF